MIKAVNKYSGLISVAFVLVVLFTCCRKQETLIGRKLIPGTDFVNGIFTDTLTLRTKTILEDTLLTENNAQFVLGALTDGVFGNSYAGIYSQVVLSSAGIGFNDTAYIDSAVLSLNLTGFYGDTNAVHNIRVYRLKDSLSVLPTTSYKSRKTFGTDSLIGQKSNYKIGKAVLATSYIDVDAQNYGPSLRIPIHNAQGQEILNQSPTGAFANNSTFLSYFKGLYIDEDTTSGTRNCMIYTNLQGGQSFLGLYYHTPHTSGNVLRLFTSGGAINTNYFNHNYKNKIVQTALLDATKTVDTALYVQSMAGLKTWVTFPSLFRNAPSYSCFGHILVNKAEVEVTMAASNVTDTSLYTTPPQMELVVADTTLTNGETIDQTFTPGFPLYGGTKFYFTDASGHKYLRYKFSIAGDLQKMLDHQYINTNGFYILTFPSNQIADRIILGGGSRGGDPYQMRLNLVYTKIP